MQIIPSPADSSLNVFTLAVARSTNLQAAAAAAPNYTLCPGSVCCTYTCARSTYDYHCVIPCMQVYGKNAKSGTAPSAATVDDSMAVVASEDKEWLILQLLSGAAECMMADKESQDKCTVRQPKTFASDAGDAVAAAAVPAGDGITAAAAGCVLVNDGSSSSMTGRRLKL
jgi:hypothetical protein